MALVAEEHEKNKSFNANESPDSAVSYHEGYYIGNYFYLLDWDCRMCPYEPTFDDDRYNEQHERLATLSKSGRQEWEQAFCHKLAAGPYQIFKGVTNCQISMQGDKTKTPSTLKSSSSHSSLLKDNDAFITNPSSSSSSLAPVPTPSLNLLNTNKADNQNKLIVLTRIKIEAENYSLTAEDQSLLSFALADAYKQIQTLNDGYYQFFAFTHSEDEMESGTEFTEKEQHTTDNKSLRGGKGKASYWISCWFYGDWECDQCKENSSNESSNIDLAVTTYADWEDAFCDDIQSTNFSTFQATDECNIFVQQSHAVRSSSVAKSE